MMMQPTAMMNPYSSASRTAEIMSRYRPIAPKPESAMNPMLEYDQNPTSMSEKIRQSPYLRNLWPQLQARPTRTRKRGRTSLSPITLKRTRTTPLFFPPACHLTSPARNLSLHGFAHGPPLPLPPLPATVTNNPESIVTLPLLPCPLSSIPTEAAAAVGTDQDNINLKSSVGEKAIDLNLVADSEGPVETDLVLQLQSPTNATAAAAYVIAPQPIRPVGSSISVKCINEVDPSGSILAAVLQVFKKSEEVEQEVESESLPAVVSDSNNKVRLANSAYMEMVGQPECSWLDSMVAASACKRISGEVMLHFLDSKAPVLSSKGFSCWVNIEWGNKGKKSSINVFCDVIKLVCDSSKDYLFKWRFHTQTPSRV